MPQLLEYHRVLYCDWIKHLPYQDDMSITMPVAARRLINSVPHFPEARLPFTNESDMALDSDEDEGDDDGDHGDGPLIPAEEMDADFIQPENEEVDDDDELFPAGDAE